MSTGRSAGARDLPGALEAARVRRAPLYALAADGQTTAFRLLHGAADGVDGLYVDVVGDWAVVHVRDAWRRRVDEALDAVARLGFRGVYLKVHPRRASGRGSAMPEAMVPRTASRGADAPAPLWVRESGLPFALDLAQGLSLGLFFDQRENRLALRAEAADRDVLNLFAYTCGFGVAAAVGGAARTTNVDVSKRALDVGRGNYRAAGRPPSEGHRFFREDAFRFLERAARRGDRYDIVCVDPPTFATAGTRRFTSGSDWVGLAAACARVLAPRGAILASSNDERLDAARFAVLVSQGVSRAGLRLRLEPGPLPLDYAPPPGRSPHLKTLWGRHRNA